MTKNTDTNTIISLIEDAMSVNREEPIHRMFIEEALRRIENGEFEVNLLPTGEPLIEDIIEIAKQIDNELSFEHE